MQAADRDAFVSLMTAALAFYRQEATTFTLGVWWEACRDFSLEQVRKALTAHARSPDRGQFPPMPADLVRVLQGTQQDRSLIAWGKVFDAMQRVGAYESVDFGDPAVHCAIEDAGGWPQLCRTPMDQLQFLQKRFCDAHRAYSNRGEAVRPVAYLPGVHESQNRASGKAPAPPVLLGQAPAMQRLTSAEAA